MKMYQNFTPAQKEMYLSNLGLARKYAWEYVKKTGADYDDLYMEGTIGLMYAVAAFNVEKGVKFSNYATPWIKKYIKDYLSENTCLMYVKKSTMNKINKIKKVIKSIEEENRKKGVDKEVTLKEIADECDYKESKVKEYLEFDSIHVLSYDIPLKNSENKTLQDLLDMDSELGVPEREVQRGESKELLTKALELLDESEKEIIFLYYGFDEGGVQRTYKEVAMLLDYSTSTVVAKKLKKSYQKIRDYMYEEGYDFHSLL